MSAGSACLHVNNEIFRMRKMGAVIMVLLGIGCLPVIAPPAFAVEISSRAAVVMDAATGKVLFAKNPDLRLMPASTTKLMTALVVLERTQTNDAVTISSRAASAPAIKLGLKEGDLVTVETLLTAALVRSANDAAVALAEAAGGSEEEFVYLMNRKALDLGLSNTRFINPNGLPGAGQYISAYDLAEIMREAVRHPLLKDILSTPAAELSTGEGRTKVVKNTNHLLWSDEGHLVGKTGFTREARHCFVAAGERETGTIVVALLGTPSRGLLWEETGKLMAFGARVQNNLEEPVVYITKVDYDAGKIKKASASKKHRVKKNTKKKKKVI
ncbi:MAG: D-alanyl-D-alanine carboxypeptidase [Nitrospirae bacterium]|nr:D-alanyl-D-alanine carboxypeptidase [Nitrospirota bacterium]